MVLGAVVIVIVGVLLVNYFSARRGEGEIVPSLDIENETGLPTTHTIEEGEDLWKISERYYKTGYNWQDIADANNLTDPNEIEVGQSLTIPDVEPRLAEALVTVSPTSSRPIQIPTSILTPTQVPEPTAAYTAPILGRTYKVVENDNLWKIAETYYESGYNWVDIARENNLENPNIIEVDQTLRIPEVSSKIVTLAGDTQNDSQAISGSTYTVQQGDSLWSISVRAYGDGFRWSDISEENKLINPNIIHSGNTLTLPR
ncbi:hypothetical protein A2714_00100 [Candidatus Woesebacteria bacterium RIFCSPHIGHO2_01_FULL_38_9]|uniref:LysM domain-containing protein n=2 Tax=Candidatus Woeseibacteriota TaxID=1752722 RepID=A0A1F7Y2G0_9BACT|nr:MAG: hypothetical protein A2714_00100 [Candidatus Woesebacteria bacterium RIFCSPHIGHO2_01_FULL_38_9]OGM58272.1 MAG: hypothetical protein A3A75_04515 [Candidatus Woesebacteria bacterium RIFCSPLOWO2_01_FULL_39_10]